MNSRQAILGRLWQHLPHAADTLEASHILKTIDFISRTPNAFERQHDTLGHVGPSAVVINPKTQQILLAQHTVLKKLSFFGNHCDGREDLPPIALERVGKDAGHDMALSCVWQPQWLDVDVHYVPPHQRSNGDNVPAHLHYDIALLFHTTHSHTAYDTARWVEITQACRQTKPDTQFQRIIDKLIHEYGLCP